MGGIALVGAAVVAGVNLRTGGEERDLLLAVLHHHDPARAQLVQIGDGDEAGRARLGAGRGFDCRCFWSHDFRRRHGVALPLSQSTILEIIAEENSFLKHFL